MSTEGSPWELIHPSAILFEGKSARCVLPDGETRTIQRAEVQKLGIYPWTKMPILVLKGGVGLVVPESQDPGAAMAWFRD